MCIIITVCVLMGVLECSCKCLGIMGINRDKGLGETIALVVAHAIK